MVDNFLENFLEYHIWEQIWLCTILLVLISLHHKITLHPSLFSNRDVNAHERWIADYVTSGNTKIHRTGAEYTFRHTDTLTHSVFVHQPYWNRKQNLNVVQQR